MADAGSTVRGTIDLNVRPARRALADLRRDARQTTAEFAGLDRQMDRSETRMRQAMERKTRSLRVQRQEVRLLRHELRGLGRERIAPTVDVRGIHRAIAAVELLIKRLNHLSRQRATPHVGIGGGLSGLAAAGARGPPSRNAFGGRGGLLRSLDLGPFQVNPRALGALTAVALPAVQQLVGAVGSLTASLGAAAAGFGALGTAAAGASAVGLGSIAAIAVPVTKQLGEVWKAQEALTSQQQSAVRTGDLQRANLDRVRSAHETLASAQRTSLYAQERLTQARKDARRELINLSLAADRSVLSEARARLAVRQSIERLREVEMDPRATPLDRDEARLSVREARFGVREAKVEGRWARTDFRRARRQGVGGMPQVVDARRGVEDARRQLVNARRGLREAGEEMSRGSDAIALAKENLDRAFSRAPRGTRQLLRDIRELRALWGAGTDTTAGRARDPNVRRAQAGFVGVLRSGVGAVRDLTPTLGRAGLRSTRALAREQTGFNRFLTGGRTRGFIDTGAAMFDENLGAWRRTTQNVMETLMNITRAARPFLRDASDFMESWTGGWRDSTRDIEGTRRRIREMVEHFKSWKNLVGATWDLLKTLGRGASGSGMSLVDSLTNQVRAWDRWAERNPQRVRTFFENAARSTAKMASALREVVQSLSQMAELLRPLLDNFTTLLTGLGALGMLQPGALALGYGAYRGLRGRGGARGGAGGAGGGGFGFVGGRGGGGPVAVRGRADPRGLMYGGNWRSGAPMSQVGARGMRSWPGRAGAGLRAGGRGALRYGVPSLALAGVLGAAGYEGNAWEKIQAGISQATLGFAPMPEPERSAADRRRMLTAQGSEQADLAIQEHGGYMPGSRRAQTQQLRWLNSELRTYRMRMRELTPEQRAEMRGTRALAAAFREQRDALRDLMRERARRRGGRAASDIQRAFGIRARDAGPEAAMERAVDQTLRTQRRLGPAGAKVVAEANLQWARQQARSNPELLDEVERLERGIKRRFSRLGRHVQIVNGQILTGSKREWRGIYDAITSRAERARQEASEEFTRLQRKAVGSLRGMGYSGSQARKIVQGIESGDTGAARDAAQGPTGAGQRPSKSDEAFVRGHARGGVIPGKGLRDNVHLGGGHYGAPGEAVITNRHTIDRVNRMLWTGGFTTTLGREAQAEQRAHSQQYRPVDGLPMGRVPPRARRRRHARGGIVPVPGFPGEQAASSILDEIQLVASRFGLTLTDAFGPGHKSPGHTIYGTAADFAGADRSMDAAVRFLVNKGYLVGYDGRFGSQRWSGHGPSYVAGGNAHLHVEFGRRDLAGARGTGGVPGMGGRVRLRARRSALGGVPGALSTRAGQMHAAGLQRKINDVIGAGAGFSAAGMVGGNARANMRAGHRMMLQRWGEGQWPALRELWMRESGWRNVMNTAGSGATGIPQALPGSKMASAGADWRTNPITQMKWGLGYISGRYGTPSAALAFHDSHNWYGRGGQGVARRPQLIGVGDRQPTGGREHFSVRKVGPGGTARVNAAGGGIQIVMHFGDVTVSGQHDLNELMGRAADHAARKLIQALERAGGVPASAIAG